MSADEAAAWQPRPIADRYPALDWSEVLSGEREPIEWLVPHVFARGRNYALVSTAKAGKSLLMQDLGGRSGVRTLYLDFENTVDDLRDRMTAMGREAGDLSGLIYLSFPALPPLDTDAGGVELADLVEHYAPDLVVIDTLARVVAGEENSSDTYRNLYRRTLMPLKAAGVTVVRLDHLGKDATAGARGSSAKADDVDCVWVLSEHTPGRRYILRRERQRSNDHPEWVNVERAYEPLRHTFSPGGVGDPSALTADVVDVVAALDDAGVPDDAGRDRSRRALGSMKTSNQTLAAAVKHRRERPKTCPGQVELLGTDLTAENLSRTGIGESAETADQTCPGQVSDSAAESVGVDLSASVHADRQDRSADAPTSPRSTCRICGFPMTFPPDVDAGAHLGCTASGVAASDHPSLTTKESQ